MGRAFFSLMFAVVGISSSVAVQAQDNEAESLALAPISAWNADFGAESCTLKRSFGDSDNPVLLQMRKYGPTKGFELTVMGKSLSPAGDGFSYAFAPGGELESPKRYMVRSFSGGAVGIMAFALHGPATADKESRDRLAQAARTLTIERGFERSLSLETGPLDSAFKVLNHCTKNLLRQWGLIDSIDGKRPRMVTILNMERVRKDLNRKWNGRSRFGKSDTLVRARIMVDASGHPTSCHPQVPTEDPEFDEISCQALMRLARFEPASDEGGNRIPSYYLFRTTFDRH